MHLKPSPLGRGMAPSLNFKNGGSAKTPSWFLLRRRLGGCLNYEPTYCFDPVSVSGPLRTVANDS